MLWFQLEKYKGKTVDEVIEIEKQLSKELNDRIRLLEDNRLSEFRNKLSNIYFKKINNRESTFYFKIVDDFTKAYQNISVKCDKIDLFLSDKEVFMKYSTNYFLNNAWIEDFIKITEEEYNYMLQLLKKSKELLNEKI